MARLLNSSRAATLSSRAQPPARQRRRRPRAGCLYRPAGPPFLTGAGD